jgi:hypothetical protein
MATIQIESDLVGAQPSAPALSNARLVPAAAAAIAFLLFVVLVAQTANPLAFFVGMAPIAWIAIEGVWHLFR